jgi:hypothetical protein
MKKVLLLVLILMSGFGLSTFAKKVDVNEAKLAGKNFFYERIKQYRDINYGSLTVAGVFTEMKNDVPLYYVFNFNTKGYIVVAADDAVPPVLAYSFDCSYSESDQPPQFVTWMQHYARQIQFAIKSNVEVRNSILQEWKHLLSPDPLAHPVFAGRDVQPFITSRWDQKAPYNCMCPVDPSGSGGHALAGCVPTAMGQIMYYYRWPETGVGSYTYMDSTYGIQHVDFGSTTYKWNNMKGSITTNNSGIGELLYHLGVSCDLVYGPTASGMYNHKAAYSLRTYFKYSPQTQYIFRDSTSLDWDSLIIAHLDRRMPLYYAGWSDPNVVGHAFVCDGYQGPDFFHFNFGWSGSFDGYFYINNLTPGGNNFNLAQELIINCCPDTLSYTYPVYCSGAENIISFKEGTIDDGSGPLHDYKSPSSCGWLLMPQGEEDSISGIALAINSFYTNPGDTLFVYDGSLQTSPLLGAFSGSSLPSDITSSGNTLLILFKVTGGNSAPGWSLTFSSTSPVWCNGTTTLVEDTAEISDGSFHFNYHNSSNCKWKLLPANGDTLTIYFRYFDTEPDNDVLKIYDLDSEELLASISGHYSDLNPPGPVTSPSGKMFLIFTSNSSVTGEGWELFYPKSTLGISETSIRGLKVFPNPAHEQVNVAFKNENYQAMTLELISVTSEKSFIESSAIMPGMVTKSFATASLKKGIYFLRITSDREVAISKIIIE